MSALTDRLYRQWLAQNRGVGVVDPDAKPRSMPAGHPPRVPPAAPAQVAPARPEKLSSFIRE